MDVEKKIKLLGKAERLLQDASEAMYDAGKLLEEAGYPEGDAGRMFEARHLLDKKMNSIKEVEKILRRQHDPNCNLPKHHEGVCKNEAHASDCNYWCAAPCDCKTEAN